MPESKLDELSSLLKQVEKHHPAKLTPSAADRRLDMHAAVQLILQNREAQPRLLEWNGQQVLMVALKTVASRDRPLPILLTDRDIEGLHAVKQLIADSFPEWPTHALLCRKAAINEFKLKAGFKHLFKMTTYDYHLQLKFREAIRLLLENKETITAIAYRVGYGHHASFTQEFKKQFGCTPNAFKKHGRQ